MLKENATKKQTTIYAEDPKMDNAKLFRYQIASKGKVTLKTVCDIIDYWYEWIFREEIYEKVVKYGGF